MSRRKQIHEMVDCSDPDRCWLWTGTVDPLGYGRVGGCLAHRRAYEDIVGPIPDGLVLDHTCHNRDVDCPGGSTCLHRRCVNPAHLEPTTRRVNTLRGRGPSAQASRRDHCSNGHEYTPANTRIRKRTRHCRACVRIRSAAYSALRRAS